MFSPTHSPINTVSDDILQIIMEKLQRDPHARLTQEGPERSWMVVTRVCRRWRRLALSTPTLWNRLDFRVVPMSKVDLFLLRSGEAPLSIFIPPGTAISEVASTVLVPNSHRIVKLLDMSNLSPLDPTPLPSGLFEREFTILEELNTTWCHEGSHEEPPIFSASNFPRVRDLRLSGGSVECSAGIMPHLTNLNITLDGDSKSLEGLMSAIEGSPLLRALSLTPPWRLPRDPLAPPHARAQPNLTPTRKVRFESLMEVCINGYDWPFAVYVLDHLLTPADCALCISAHTEDHATMRQRALPTILCTERPWYRPIQYPDGTLTVRIERDSVSVNPWTRVGLRMPRGFFSLELTTSPWAVDFGQGVADHVGEEALASIAGSLSDAAGAVEMLDVKLATSEAARWRTFLERFPHVVCLRCSRSESRYYGGLTESGLSDVFAAMCDALKSRPPGDDPAVLCPKLRHLTGFVDDGGVGALFDVVKSRAPLDSRLEEVTVIGGTSFDAESDLMRELKGIIRTEVVRDVGDDNSGLRMMAFSKEVQLVPETSAGDHERCSKCVLPHTNVSLSRDEVQAMMDRRIWG